MTISREKVAECSPEYQEIMSKESHHDHEIVKDEHGRFRWRENPTVCAIIDKGILNDLMVLFGYMGLTKNSEAVRKLYRDMGYSLFGYWEVFYWEANNEDAHLYEGGDVKRAKNSGTSYFAEKTGDKLFVEISITGDPDVVVSNIMKSISQGDELFEGARCEQMLFKGKSIDGIIKDATAAALNAIRESVESIERDMRYGRTVDGVTGE